MKTVLFTLCVVLSTSYAFPGQWNEIVPAEALINAVERLAEHHVFTLTDCKITAVPQSEIQLVGQTAEQTFKLKVVCDHSINSKAEMEALAPSAGFTMNISSDCDQSITQETETLVLERANQIKLNVSSVCDVVTKVGANEKKLKSTSLCKETLIWEVVGGSGEIKSKVSLDCNVTSVPKTKEDA